MQGINCLLHYVCVQRHPHVSAAQFFIFDLLPQFFPRNFLHSALVVGLLLVHFPEDMCLSQILFLFEILVEVCHWGFGNYLVLPSIRIADLEIIIKI